MAVVLRPLFKCERANANHDTINSQHIKKQALTCVSACLIVLVRSQVLALRELEAPAGFALTELLTFHNPAVAGQEAGGFQGAAQAGFIEL